MKTAVLFACILVIISFSNALPIESELSTVELKSKEVGETTQTTLLDVDQLAASDDDLKRTARGLGLGGHGGFGGGFGGLGGKFGGLGGHGLGGFGHGLGGLGGLGGGFGGGFKKPFSFKGF